MPDIAKAEQEAIIDPSFDEQKHRGRSIDIETGDLILEEPHQQEHWVIKRNMMGHIIDLYRVETYDEIR
jgi:hypothetical protein